MQDYRGITQMAGGNQYKKLHYDYDLISGKVNKVHYQPGFNDAFHHKYEYDAENRLKTVETSRDEIVWERDANYSYYKHGALARTTIGHLNVQGIDYAYTLQGWLKGVNSTNLDSFTDIGGDGLPGSVVAKDVLGFALHYYDDRLNVTLPQDFKPVGGNSPFANVGAIDGFSSLYMVSTLFGLLR